jgi:hypothetical protein
VDQWKCVTQVAATLDEQLNRAGLKSSLDFVLSATPATRMW